MSLPAATVQRLPASVTRLGEGMVIRRALPTRLRRMIGPWCFLDHFGPVDVVASPGMRVGPHPHIGLQTVTWLYQGEILHRDSLGSVQGILPGQLNLMTSGRGISHSEESPPAHGPILHGLQFWIALPEAASDIAPAFAHHPQLPQVEVGGLHATVLVGTALGLESPARMYSPVMGLDLQARGESLGELPLQKDFEHAVLLSEGEASVDGEALVADELLYLGGGRERLKLRAAPGARLTLIGGEPFATPVSMWWNFVARSKTELAAACAQWNAADPRFGEVRGYDGDRIPAPLPPW